MAEYYSIIMPNTDIQTALDVIKEALPHRRRFINYYDGNHELAFATEKFKTAFGLTLKNMRDNLCPIVVDAVADRMEIINFAGDEEGKDSAIAAAAWKLWQREQMELVSNETHVEALKTGCAYMIVWGNEQNQAKFYLQDSRNVCVIKDEENGTALFAAKQWEAKDGRIRLTLYYADRIEKWITQKKREAGGEIKESHFIEINIPGEEFLTENPYSVIPVFEFECRPVLNDAIPMQDCLNKTLADRLVTQEFAAFRQRWATGLEPPMDELTGVQKKLFDGGADKLWFTNDQNVTFGDFEASAIDPFLKAADSDKVEMARVTGTPLHFFSINTSDAISGKALKTLESRFTKKAKRLCLNFGAVWSAAMKLALTIEQATGGDNNLTTQWDSVETRDEEEFLDSQLKKQELGVPLEVLLEEYGYTAEDLKRFKKLEEPEPGKPNEDPAVTEARRMAKGG